MDRLSGAALKRVQYTNSFYIGGWTRGRSQTVTSIVGIAYDTEFIQVETYWPDGLRAPFRPGPRTRHLRARSTI